MADLTKKKKYDFSGLLQSYVVVLVGILLIILFCALKPDSFATSTNMKMILGSVAPLRIMLALGIMIPLIAGDYDMSAGATMALSSMVVAHVYQVMNMPLVVAITMGILSGALIGALNGFIVTKFNINPFIVTMGTQTLVSGLALGINTQNITITRSDTLSNVAVYKIGGLPLVFFYTIILCLILFYIFEKTSVGKRVLIVGSNQNVAKLSGIKVKRVRFLCFLISGAIAGVAGVLYTGKTGSGSPQAAMQYLMPAFAAVFLGSTIIKIGRYNPIGTLIAIYFLETTTTGLQHLGAPSWIQNIFYGGALIGAVLFAVFGKTAQERRKFKAEQIMRNKEIEERRKAKENEGGLPPAEAAEEVKVNTVS